MIIISVFAGSCALLFVHSSYSWRNREIAIPVALERDHTSDAIFGRTL